MIKVFIISADLEKAKEFMNDLGVSNDDWQYIDNSIHITKEFKTTPFYIIFGFVDQAKIVLINYLKENEHEELETTIQLLKYLEKSV